MGPFIKIVEDLNTILKTGSNESFFRGEDYSLMSDSMAKSVRTWCQKNLGTVKLKSENAKDDEPLELYIIHLAKAKVDKDLRSFMTEMAGVFVKIVSATARDIDTKNVMTAKVNEAFDAVEEAACLRTFLLRVDGKRRAGPSPALLLNV